MINNSKRNDTLLCNCTTCVYLSKGYPYRECEITTMIFNGLGELDPQKTVCNLWSNVRRPEDDEE